MNEDILTRVDLFSTLDKKELQVLAGSCQERLYNAGSTIFAQGDAGVGLYVLKNGKIRLTQTRRLRFGSRFHECFTVICWEAVE